MTVSATVQATGPASYATGGMVVTTGLASVGGASVVVDTAGGLMPVEVEVAVNAPGAGQVTLRLLRRRYDKLTGVGNMTGLPAGITAGTVSGGVTDADTGHVHALDHDHAAATSAAMSASGAGTPVDVTGPLNIGTHTHSFNPPAHTGNTGPDGTHTHTFNSLYEHQHTVTQTATDTTLSEVPAGTDLSGATLTILAVGT